MSCAFHLRCEWPCPIQARVNEEVTDRQRTITAQSFRKYAAKKSTPAQKRAPTRGILNLLHTHTKGQPHG